ncbi:MAG: hypothetical protein OXG35_00460, partial [Acidobacteria bacterium]|nr:hypothetical protein [Acidobacteriota bacterium]
HSIRPLPPPGVDYRSASVSGLLRPGASRELCTDLGLAAFQEHRKSLTVNGLREFTKSSHGN